jgi:hypothetical protein
MTKETKETKAAPAPVSGNPALVEFPRDTWGFTSDLRKAGLLAASAVRGSQEKQDLLLATLRVIAQHSLARFDGDAEAVQVRLAEIAERDSLVLHRQYGRVAPTE